MRTTDEAVAGASSQRSPRQGAGEGQPDLSLAARARRGQLVDCAIDALCELGFAGTSVAEVARRAGVSKGVVTYHFPSKEALLRQVVMELYERGGQRIAAATDPAHVRGPAKARGWLILRGYITANLAFVAENRRHVRAALEVLANLRGPDGALVFAPAGPDPVTAHLRDLLREGMSQGEFAKLDASHLAIIFRSAIDTAAARAAVDPGFDSAAYTETLLEIAARTLRVSR